MTELPVIESCENCGECCMTQCCPPGYTSILFSDLSEWPDSEDVRRSKNLPEGAVAALREYMSSDIGDNDPCCWLDLETLRCRWYEHRPQICRDVALGSECCRYWRGETDEVLMKQTPFKKLGRMVLVKDASGKLEKVMDVTPTMKSITVEGERYHRLSGVRTRFPDGTEAATYLWDGYKCERTTEA